MKFLKNNNKLNQIDLYTIKYKILFTPMSKRNLKRLLKIIRRAQK